MPLSDLIHDYANGDQTSWPEEVTWIKANHPRRLARITREIQAGNFPPIRLDFEEQRVVDGHHRITAALDLQLTEIPVDDAWGTDQDWWLHASDSGADDPEQLVDPDKQAWHDLHAPHTTPLAECGRPASRTHLPHERPIHDVLENL
ncbi:hypothetical protein [Streptomyces sp. NBC_01268]|uniref:hypothetical protein n=1 Tax=Streptomyces sp. NBC_01268 TaxID=2903806 RepID=UPI002E3005B2|nr:hypothetical protein [Streptomyces sp. NBC_01268]